MSSYYDYEDAPSGSKYVVEYNNPDDPQTFCGDTRDAAVAAAKNYDSDWGTVSRVLFWNGHFYQCD